MCFNQPISFSLSVFGLCSSIFVYYKTKNIHLFYGVFFFFLMEFLQFFQYFVIDECDTFINKFLTLLGLIHICFQPYFTHYLGYGLAKSKSVKICYKYVLRFCLLGALLLFGRFGFSFIKGTISDNTEGFQIGYHSQNGTLKGSETVCGRSTEWLRGNQLCTFSGRYHLGWSVPMTDSTYFFTGVGLHSFLMFGPFLIIDHDTINKFVLLLSGLILFLTGPIFARMISDDLMEQASIWCFFSVFQVFFLVLGILFFDKFGVNEEVDTDNDDEKKRK